jgi:hypothetical protein
MSAPVVAAAAAAVVDSAAAEAAVAAAEAALAAAPAAAAATAADGRASLADDGRERELPAVAVYGERLQAAAAESVLCKHLLDRGEDLVGEDAVAGSRPFSRQAAATAPSAARAARRPRTPDRRAAAGVAPHIE